MRPRSIWATLDLERTRDRTAIRRAYGRLLKVTSPEDDAEAFQILRTAYEQALRYAEHGVDYPDFDFAEMMAIHDGDDGDGSDDAIPGEVVIADDDAGARLWEAPPQPAPEPTPEPARPQPLPEDVAARMAHQRRIGDLERLLADGAPEADLQTALSAVLAAPAMESVAVHAWTERRLAELIGEHIPRSDPLVRPLIDHFRWTAGGVQLRTDYRIRTVLDRREALRFLNGIENPQHPHYQAWRVLTRPPPRSGLWRTLTAADVDGDVRAFLDLLRYSHPDLLEQLDRPSLEWWGERLARPRIWGPLLWLVPLLPILGAMAAFATAGNGAYAGARAALAYVGGVAVMLAFTFGWLYAIAWPRQLWRERWSWRAAPWQQFGWAPAAPLLLIAAALTPPSIWAAIVIGLLGVAIALWVLITGEADRRPGGYGWMVRAAMAQGYLAIWWLVAAERLAPGVFLQMTIAQTAAALVSVFGAGALMEVWALRLTSPMRLGGLMALAILAFTAISALSALGQRPELAPMAAALVSGVVLGHRVVADTLGPDALRVRHYLMWAGLLGLVVWGGPDLDRFVWGGALLLGGVAVTIAIGAFAERRGSAVA